MNGIKKYFSPPQMNVKVSKKKSDDGNAKNSVEEKEIPGDLIVKNMEEVLKSVNKKIKKEKHKRKHKERCKKDREDDDTKELDEKPENNNDSKLKSDQKKNGSEVPADNKENVKEQPLKKQNAFQMLMNARKRSIGDNLEGKELNGIDSAKTQETRATKRKRKEMLQEWADSKGGRQRVEKDIADEEYIKHEMNKRKTRMKKFFKTKINSDNQDVSDDEEFVVKKKYMKGKPIKRGIKRRRKSTSDESEVEIVEKINGTDDDFTKKLSSPTKKRDSLFGYFSKIEKNDTKKSGESESNPTGTPRPNTSEIKLEIKKKRGRPCRQKVESPSIKETSVEIVIEKPIVDQEKHGNTPTSRSRRRKKSEENVEKIEILEVETPKKEPDFFQTPSSSSRPRRSCATKKISYASLLESPQKDTPTKPRKKKREEDDPSIVISDDSSSTPPARNGKLAPIFCKPVPKPAVDPELLKARQEFLRSGLPETMQQEIAKQKEFEDNILNNSPLFPLISSVNQSDYSLEKIDFNSSRIKIRPLEEDLSVSNYRLGIGNFSDCQGLIISSSRKQLRALSFQYCTNRKSAGRKLKLAFERFPTYKCYHQLHEKFKKMEGQSGELFTEKYRPTGSENFLVNSSPVQTLKRFLSSWKQNKTLNCDSSDDFEENSNTTSSQSLGANVVLIHGPSGSGKTSSVMALANEMNFNVLEVNGGSKRTGKKMLQELQEATQSHGVRNQDQEIGSKEKLTKQGSFNETTKKISLILIEDSDVVFEQDDGFVNGINQLVNLSKRPVILTATDPNQIHLQRFLYQNSIEFKVASPINASKYLTVMCLAENFTVDDIEIRKLYEMNKCDMRKTILEMQFYLQTGGDLQENVNKRQLTNGRATPEDMLIEVIPVTEDDLIEIEDENSKFSVQDDLQKISNTEYKHRDIYSFYTKDQNRIGLLYQKPTVRHFKINSNMSLDDINFVYNNLSIASQMISKTDEFDRLNPQVCDDLGQILMDETLAYSIKIGNKEQLRSPKSTIPKLQPLHENLSSCLMSSRANHVDYEPILREMCRSERQRLSLERKGSRFYHYLRSFNTNSFSTDYFDQFCLVLNDSHDKKAD